MPYDQVTGDYSSVMKASLSGSNSKARGGTELDFDSFLALIAAQMRNQDMNNPVSDTEFIGQMAQFTSLQAMQELSALNMTSYSVGLLGKEVTAAKLLENGSLFTETGVVTGIGLFDGEPVVYIGDNAYTLAEVMAVGKLPAEKPEGDGADTGETGSETAVTP